MAQKSSKLKMCPHFDYSPKVSNARLYNILQSRLIGFIVPSNYGEIANNHFTDNIFINSTVQ